jgi:hypothetical protein
MDLSITLVDITENPQFVVPSDGTYLVKRRSSSPLYTYMQVRVVRRFDEKRCVWVNAFDVSPVTSEAITHISSQPLKF